MTAPATPKIVHLIPRDGLGGVEAAARVMAGRSDLACRFKIVSIAHRPEASLNNPASYARALKQVMDERPDVLLCSLWRSVPVALTAKLLRPAVKLVTFIHCDTPVHRADALFHHLAMQLSDEVWGDSQAALDARVASAQRRRTRVISFVLDRLAPSAPAPVAPRFVSWARMNDQKGVDRSIDLMAALHAVGIVATLDLWGPDNGLQADLERQRDKRGLSSHVRFRGATSRGHLPEIAAENCFYLQPSRYEGMAMAVVEAMQLGLVPVVTPVGQMAHYVRDGANGLIISPNDHATTATRFAALLSEPATVKQMRKAAIATWRDAPLYPDEVCRSARALLSMPEELGPGGAISAAG